MRTKKELKAQYVTLFASACLRTGSNSESGIQHASEKRMLKSHI